jgi:hypothetical protein
VATANFGAIRADATREVIATYFVTDAANTAWKMLTGHFEARISVAHLKIPERKFS